MTLETLFSLDSKIIVVTGGYGYLGQSIVRGLAGAGAVVVVIGRNRDKFDEVLGSCRNVYFQQADLSLTEEVQTAFARIKETHGSIDVLINNAHYGMGGAVDHLSDEAWAKTIDGTVGNYHRCIREVLPYFRSQRRGNIINVSSMYGMVAPDFTAYADYPAFTNPPHYGAGKAAILQLTKYFASLLGKEHIRVNAVSPGPFPSTVVQQEEGFVAELASRTALNRIGDPEELAATFIYLAAKASSYVTGQNIVVDGGWTIT